MTLEMRGICKSFGSNDVLKHVDFSIQGGEICALLGENGAGKSTLMNILGGVLPADRGEIVIDGAAVHFRTPSDSLSAGVAFIHQELSLINDLAIYENMFIGRELKTKYGLLDAKTMIQKTQEVFDRLELHLDPRTMVRELDASYKQIVEISRAMMMEASLIIMDEPTTSLTDPEIERVFDMMRMLQKQNVAIVFISHKLKEVMEVCNRYTVLRDGNMVAAGPVAEVTTADLARFMVGHDVRTENLHQDKELGGEILRGEGLGDGTHFRDISFTVHAGEVLGVTGLLGDGRSELFQAVFGDLPYTGQLFVEGRPVKVTSTPQAIRLGIGYVPRNRKENGIIKDVKFLTFGCGAAIATSSMATELIKGKSIEEALKLTNKAVVEALDGLPPIKVHCSVLAEQAVKAALSDYYRRQGIDPEPIVGKLEEDCHDCNGACGI